MNISPGAFVRVGLLALAAIVLQLAGVGQIKVLGSSPDLVPLFVAAVAFYAGSMAGTTTGFATGFLLDLAAGQAMGLSSLVLSGVGYGVGRFREVRDPSHGLVPLPVAAAATAGWVGAFAAVSFMLDIGTDVSPLVLRDLLVTSGLNALIALPVFALCRFVLRPVLAVDPFDMRRRRRPVRQTGPIGLRGLEV